MRVKQSVKKFCLLLFASVTKSSKRIDKVVISSSVGKARKKESEQANNLK